LGAVVRPSAWLDVGMRAEKAFGRRELERILGRQLVRALELVGHAERIADQQPGESALDAAEQDRVGLEHGADRVHEDGIAVDVSAPPAGRAVPVPDGFRRWMNYGSSTVVRDTGDGADVLAHHRDHLFDSELQSRTRGLGLALEPARIANYQRNSGHRSIVRPGSKTAQIVACKVDVCESAEACGSDSDCQAQSSSRRQFE
jgi:hypothetical protein